MFVQLKMNLKRTEEKKKHEICLHEPDKYYRGKLTEELHVGRDKTFPQGSQ